MDRLVINNISDRAECVYLNDNLIELKIQGEHRNFIRFLLEREYITCILFIDDILIDCDIIMENLNRYNLNIKKAYHSR